MIVFEVFVSSFSFLFVLLLSCKYIFIMYRFTSIIGMLKSPIVKCIILSSFRVYVLASLLLFLVVGISSWSYSIYNKAYKRILVLANNEQTLDHCSDLNKLFPLFCYNPQLMYLYSQVCKGKCSLDQELSLLQNLRPKLHQQVIFIIKSEIYGGVKETFMKRKSFISYQFR